MHAGLKVLALGLCVALPSAALAQDTGQGAAATPPAADGNATDTSGLSMGQGDAAPKAGDPYVREVFGDWQLRCVKAANGKEPCQVFQLLHDQNGNNVAEFSLFDLPAGQTAVAGATVVTPLETLLTAELHLSVDNGQVKRYPYSFCTKIGCFARIGLTAEELDGFKKGVAANVVIVAAGAPDKTVDLSASLKGFTAAWTALVAANAQ